jgi:predicted dehydrogenase
MSGSPFGTKTSRRRFLGAATVAATASYFAWTQLAFANSSKNDRPTIGCIGTGKVGMRDGREHAKFGDVVAVCDVDNRHCLQAKYDNEIGRGRADAYEDYRRILDRCDVDVVSIVTPEHVAWPGTYCQFRWWYEYSGGKFTDWGAHHIDIALWAMRLDRQGSGPIEIDGSDAKHPVPFNGGYPTVDNCYNTSHDFNVVHRFEDGLEMHVTSRGDNGILRDCWLRKDLGSFCGWLRGPRGNARSRAD